MHAKCCLVVFLLIHFSWQALLRYGQENMNKLGKQWLRVWVFDEREMDVWENSEELWDGNAEGLFVLSNPIHHRLINKLTWDWFHSDSPPTPIQGPHMGGEKGYTLLGHGDPWGAWLRLHPSWVCMTSLYWVWKTYAWALPPLEKSTTDFSESWIRLCVHAIHSLDTCLPDHAAYQRITDLCRDSEICCFWGAVVGSISKMVQSQWVGSVANSLKMPSSEKQGRHSCRWETLILKVLYKAKPCTLLA